MSAGRLYGPKANGRVSKVRIAAKLSGVELDYDESFEFGKTNKSPEYLAKFPLGQTPHIESKDGLLLTESTAIAFHAANLKDNNPLLGKNKNELAKIHQYAFFAETQIMPHSLALVLPAWGYAPYNEATEKSGYQGLDKALDYLNKELENKHYLVGDSITLADIVVGEDLGLVYSMIMDEPYRNKYPNLTKFYHNYRENAHVKEIGGPIKLAEKPLQVSQK
ncbi:Elongation factor 1-gamma [Entomophthora muscae]|uniref:Elongation factor 1-gamma n=1 Tax=Entomophthora muscae TaxID=34485 RepID=A0ACC2S241_9FUNG|nr:Elongation factor 1-gamma [Entomophthora muscae]